MAKLQQIAAFEPGDNPAESWAEWRRSYEIYERASRYHKEDEETRICLLLHVIGKQSNRDYRTFSFPTPAQGQEETRTVKEVLDKFDEHYRPYKNTTLASSNFGKLQQKPGQTIDNYVTELRLQADQCDFGSAMDRNIRDKLIQGIADRALRERLFRESNLSLQQTIEMCKTAELSKQHANALDSASACVEQLSIKKPNNRSNNNFRGKTNNQRDKSNYQPARANGPDSHGRSTAAGQQQNRRPCSRCGTVHQPRHCPAYGKSCHNCGMENHFSKVCRQPRSTQFQPNKVQRNFTARHVELLQQNDENDVAYLGELTVNELNNDANEWLETISAHGRRLTFKLDTGAQVNVLPLKELSNWAEKPIVHPTTTRVSTYSGEFLPVVGECFLTCGKGELKQQLRFIVINVKAKPILGINACKSLRLIQRTIPALCQLKQNAHSPSELATIVKEYSDLFMGVGQLPGVHKIVLRDNAVPKVASARKVPLALESKLKAELCRMERTGIIAKVHEPTDWVNAITIVQKKDGSLRICLDPRDLNSAIKRQHYQIPSPEVLLAKLKGSTSFTLLDAEQAFYHLTLDEESSYLCTFITPFGRYRFLVMPMGINCAPEIFQKAMDDLYANYPHINPYFDDVLVNQ